MSKLRTVGLGAVVVLLAAGAAVGGFGITDAVRGDRAAPTSAARTPGVVTSATASPSLPSTSSTGAAAAPAAVARALSSVLRAPALGDPVRARVIDVASGTVLYDRDSTSPGAPASTAKILTAAALLSVRAPTDRISTTLRQGANGTVALVGGGDPTLTGAAEPADAAYPDAARISDLARQLTAQHVPVRRIVVDDSAFAGPSVSSAWAPEDVPSEYGAAITAVLADGGRDRPGATIRSAAPDLAAGRELAAAIGSPSLPVSRGTVGSGRTLATVRSAPFSVLIEQMLLESDNVIAECLARQVAIATGAPASFAGAAAAVRTVLRQRLGINPGAGLVDGSGLADRDRVAPSVLAGVLRLAAGPTQVRLRALVTGLPVAAWSGTLDDRFLTGAARTGAGVVRAKTGTLTGVSALAGLVHDRSGRLLAFAFIADRAGATPAAEAALDAIAARLARCGCD